jgi:SAM-dependent methyltransferase
MPVLAQNINDQFFSGSYKEVWKHLNPQGLTEAECDFIMEMGGLQPNSKVLDFMCGYGRHVLELAKRGCQVTGVDNLRPYTEEIREHALENNLPIQVIENDILQAELAGPYDTAICMGNSFAFFGREDAMTILENISFHLKPGATLIINSWTVAEIAIRYFKQKDWHYAGEYKCILENAYHFQPARIEFEQTIISKNGEVEISKGIDYIFTLDELDQMFNVAGFKTMGLFSTPRKKKFSFGDTQIYIVAAKSD